MCEGCVAQLCVYIITVAQAVRVLFLGLADIKPGLQVPGGFVRFVGSVRSGVQQQSDPGWTHPHRRQEGQSVPGGGLPPGRGGSE